MGSKQVAILLAAAFTAGCAIYAASDAAAANPMAPAAAATAAPPDVTEPRGRAYFFRGFAGWIFSRGVDRLAKRVAQTGYATLVDEAATCPSVAKAAIRDYRLHPAPIAVFGHSVGGACALAFAEMLNDAGIPVKLLVTTDPAKISHDVAPNVERYINIFLSNSIVGGRDVRPSKDFQGHYASFDLAEHKEITHLNIEKTASIHDQLLAKIEHLATMPAKAESETVPLRYVVPADAEIELWDSGVPLLARSGDTLPQLAALHHLPLWSLVQMNQGLDTAPLRAGQRIVIPRYLDPNGVARVDVISDQAQPK